MADLYPTYSRQYQRQDHNTQYQLAAGSSISGVMYPPQLTQSQSTLHDDSQQSSPIPQEGSASPISQPSSSPKQDSPTAHKSDATISPQPTKPQATFLTKLYALLERPENHHMIRWDQAGEHIIVERPEQLALHVLPSVYRQSRFASFSRQLNIYGFMRKVNLRNVDPAIDDPDASTWSHPTLNRQSPPEVVANFKRRVPPRLPKPRKRDLNTDLPTIPPPRSAGGMGLPMVTPGSPGRRRGLSAPGSFTPLTQPGAAGWTTSYRTALPPLTVPDTHHHPSSLSAHPHNGMYPHSHPLTPADEPPPSSSAYTPLTSYSGGPSANNGRDMILPSPHAYPYPDQTSHWSYPTGAASAASSSSLSSLLNPHSSTTGGYGARPTPHINTYQHSSYPSLPTISRPSHHGGGSPESRPTTGYSVSSISSLSTPYDETAPHSFEYSRPSSSHRPLTPASSRPTSSKASYNNASTLSVRRDRRHSHAMSPYPSPYTDHPSSSERPSTSPHPGEGGHGGDSGGLPRMRSMQTMGMGEAYGYNPAQADFAFGAVDEHPHSGSSGGAAAVYGRSVRPSTSASSLSGSSSAANTPAADGYGAAGARGENVDITRCE
ncbi:HSF-type DNA-binding-domain-containing protein [Cytidiella melzeri]|nr:HSF-type DNA-binding-domain-containing protein [Cytidiella melzeri]